MIVAKAAGLSYTDAARLPYDTFLAILLTTNADGLSELDRYAEERKKMERENAK